MGLGVSLAVVYPWVRTYISERHALEVDVAPVLAASGGTSGHQVLVATGYVVARRSSEVGVKTGGRLAVLGFEEGTRVRRGEVIARLEHGEAEAQLQAARHAVSEAEALLQQMAAVRDEDARNLERQRTLNREGLTPAQALTAAESAHAVSVARVRSAEAAILTARARLKVAEEVLENTNVRAPFDGVVIKKRAEVGETVSPFGVAGQAAREGGAIATIADLSELEVQTEVGESNIAKLALGMPAEITIKAYPERTYAGRVRQIFPSADRAKAIVEIRVAVLNPDIRVKPEMTASVTFQEPRSEMDAKPRSPRVLVPKNATTEAGGETMVWVVNAGTVSRRRVAVAAERTDRLEVEDGVAAGETVVVNPPADLAEGRRVRLKGQ